MTLRSAILKIRAHNRLHRSTCRQASSSIAPLHKLVYNRDTGTITDERTSQQLYRSIIGIEIHAQLAVPTKLFSSGPTKHHPEHTSDANTSFSLHDIAYPGTLPLLSKSAVQKALISAAALNCDIQELSRFERKHYTYADLPFGYQVTQQRWPIAKEGILKCRRYSPPQPNQKKVKEMRRRGGRGDSSVTENASVTSLIQETGSDGLSKFFEVGIDRIQMEQDTGKTTAVSLGGSKTQYLIDFNRAGSTLIEIVFRPQIHSAHEAASVVSTLQSLLKYLGTCDGKMEEGSVRCDLNVSICPISLSDNNKEEADPDNPFKKYLPKGVGNRVEVKNLNSLKQIIQSAEFEALRQTSQILDGSPTGRETRTFDPKTGNTTKIRDKGGAVDYRFMPEPDLPPVKLNRNILGKDSLQEFLEDNLPELPEEATNRLTNEYGIPEASALIITSDRPAILFFEDAIARCITELKEGNQISTDKVSISIANWLCNDVFALIKESAMKKEGEDTETEGFLNHPISVEHSNVDSTRLGSLVALILNKTVSTTQGKKLLGVMYNEDMNSLPLEIAEQNNWKLISDLNQLKTLCRDVIMDGKNAKQFEQYKQGGKNVRKMTKFFTGKIMAESRGNAQPEILGTALQIMLEELAPGVEE
jgi:aspartyl-tRNA(Asn)/glutamyl-tRNA(Gln) amidotransferase subunit B